jgi:hypothetical protein
VGYKLSEKTLFLAVYGSLRRRTLAKQGFFVQRNLRFHGRGVLKGLLFCQNGYPGVLEQPGLVKSKFIASSAKWCGQSLTDTKGVVPRLAAVLFSTEKKSLFCIRRFRHGSIFSEERSQGEPNAPAACRPQAEGVALRKRFLFSGVALILIRIDNRWRARTID